MYESIQLRGGMLIHRQQTARYYQLYLAGPMWSSVRGAYRLYIIDTLTLGFRRARTIQYYKIKNMHIEN